MDKVFKCLGATNHSEEERQESDYYATHPSAVEALLKAEDFKNKIYEPACGEGNISKCLIKNGYDVISSDLIDYGFGETGIDFFSVTENADRDIITNPPL